MLANLRRAIGKLPGQLFSFTTRAYHWLMELWQLWACIAGVAVMGAAFAYSKPCDLWYRLVGMAAQLVGVGIAVWALLGVRQFFGLPRFRQNLREWWARRPGWVHHRRITAGTGNMQMEGMASNMRGQVKYNRELPVPEWLNVLTDAVENLHRTLGDVDAKHTEALKTIEMKLKVLSNQHAAETAKIEEKLKTVQTGGVAVALIGAVLVAIGTVLTALPVEAAYFFGNWTPMCVFP